MSREKRGLTLLEDKCNKHISACLHKGDSFTGQARGPEQEAASGLPKHEQSRTATCVPFSLTDRTRMHGHSQKPLVHLTATVENAVALCTTAGQLSNMDKIREYVMVVTSQGPKN